MPKTDVAADLAGKLLESLRRHRDRDDAYPLTVARTADNQAATVADLTRKIGRNLQRPLRGQPRPPSGNRLVAPAIGSLRIEKKPYPFLTREVGSHLPAPAAFREDGALLLFVSRRLS